MLKQLSLLCIVGIITLTHYISEAKTPKPKQLSSPIQTNLVVDANTGKVLYDKNSKTRIYPASLTKLMTLYLAFEAVESGKLSLHQKLRVSHNATKVPPLKLWLKAGDYITVREAILGMIVRSANDASVVIAEKLTGSEQNFALLMNAKAKQLGMKDTHFKNAHGLHHPMQKTTARDLAKLSMALKRDYPKYYPLFSRTEFVFRGDLIKGHNKVTANYQGAEGLKTGYTTPAGFNLITTASRNNKSLLAVVTGGKTAASRNARMVQLLDHHFDNKPIKAKPTIKLASNQKVRSSKKRL